MRQNYKDEKKYRLGTILDIYFYHPLGKFSRWKIDIFLIFPRK